MAKRRRVRWDRVIMVFGPLLLLILILFFSCGGSEKGKKDPSEISAESPSSMEIAEQTGTTALPAETTAPADPAAVYKNELIVVIDAGHGGKDAGALNDPNNPTRLEKDDVLRLALAVKKAFEKYPNIRVIMTRETDEFIELKDRCAIANNAAADFFISIHRNSALTGDGVEIWINNDAGGDNTMDKLLATYIMELLKEVGISQDRGIKSGFRNSSSNEQSNNYYVNRNTDMPSCLIEMGFMSSEADNNNFDTHLDEYAEAIATAVVELVTDRNLFDVETIE
ncbi:MAG: N-acetylmuramoyl-L-alanine amidase [Oscillospiraceae bacterium]|nr:N-acetylmuramoyl-L-alanine amidase [Oscillospiraceae bacterium]